MFLGVDLGTNSLKAGLFDENGRLTAEARRSYALQRIGERGVAQDPDEWWRATCAALGEILVDVTSSDVSALCVVGQGPSLVVCDEHQHVLAPALIWADQRANLERLRLSELLGSEVSVWSLLPKVSWLYHQHPEAFSNNAHVTQAYDFIAARLCGATFASQFGEFPPFSAAEFVRLGFDPRWIPPVIPMRAQVGVTRAPWCGQAHLAEGIPVIAGVYDAIATTLGTGLIEIGRACDYGGNSGGYGLCWHEPLRAAGINAWPGLLPHQHILGGATANAGSSIDWFARTFGGLTRFNAALRGADSIRAGANGLIFLPYLMGERAPLWDDHLRGAFVGLSLHHGYEHLLRSVFEGVAFEVRNLAEAVGKTGAVATEMRVCGGTARYDLLNRIKADVLGVPVLVPEVIEASLLGAAMLGALGVDCLNSYAEAAARMVHIGQRIDPDSHQHEIYSEVFGIFEKLTAMRIGQW